MYRNFSGIAALEVCRRICTSFPPVGCPDHVAGVLVVVVAVVVAVVLLVVMVVVVVVRLGVAELELESVLVVLVSLVVV